MRCSGVGFRGLKLLSEDQWGSNRAFSEHCLYIKIPPGHSSIETKSKLELMRYESRADMGILQAIRAEKHTLNLNAFRVHHAAKNNAQQMQDRREKGILSQLRIQRLR